MVNTDFIIVVVTTPVFILLLISLIYTLKNKCMHQWVTDKTTNVDEGDSYRGYRYSIYVTQHCSKCGDVRCKQIK